MSAESRIHPFYACPTTGDPLHRNGDVLENSDGSRRYPIVRGVPVFLRHEPLESASDAEKLERLGSLARSSDWRSAIQEVYGEHPYTTATSRMNCLDLLPLTETSTVLEIGASLGQFTPEIRRRAGRVYGLEVVQGQAEFAAERCRQEELDEVYLACGGDDCRLPYEDGSFDIVILSLVLEWCASRHGDEPAETVQRRMLSECCRVLRAGGSFYVSTKNRYALRQLTGKPDEHSQETPFGSALPRWLLGLVLKLRGKPAPEGRLYSYPRLEQLLREAGFASMRSYWAAPEMRFPDHHVPTDAASIANARRQPGFVQGEYRSTRWLMPWVPARWVKFFTPGLLFVATKDDEAT